VPVQPSNGRRLCPIGPPMFHFTIFVEASSEESVSPRGSAPIGICPSAKTQKRMPATNTRCRRAPPSPVHAEWMESVALHQHHSRHVSRRYFHHLAAPPPFFRPCAVHDSTTRSCVAKGLQARLGHFAPDLSRVPGGSGQRGNSALPNTAWRRGDGPNGADRFSRLKRRCVFGIPAVGRCTLCDATAEFLGFVAAQGGRRSAAR